MAVRYNVETNKQKNKHGYLSENTNPGSFFAHYLHDNFWPF